MSSYVDSQQLHSHPKNTNGSDELILVAPRNIMHAILSLEIGYIPSNTALGILSVYPSDNEHRAICPVRDIKECGLAKLNEEIL